MLGRGLYSSKNKKLPGIYCRFYKTTNRYVSLSDQEKRRVQLFTSNDGQSNITLTITQGYGFEVGNDSEGNITLSTGYGCTLEAINNAGEVTLEVI